jgi:hypothetical protein
VVQAQLDTVFNIPSGPEKPVLRGLPKLIYEDLQWVSILTCRSLDSRDEARASPRNVVDQVVLCY